MSLSVVVLAAGQGKRMQSELPKVLHPIAGRPMLSHVLETARALRPAAIHVVYGHGGETVKASVGASDVNWCLQAEQLGTGHAVAQALPSVVDGDRVLILCGDVPLVKAETLEPLLCDSPAVVKVLTTRLADPTGYGRIVRNGSGAVTGIVEQKEATTEQLAIDEINTGIMAIEAAHLRKWLGRLDNDNAQGEYYLTDVIAMAVEDGETVLGIAAREADEVLGVNDKTQLATTERLFQRRLADMLMREGATLADPDRIDVRGRLTVGKDVSIDVGVVFVGDVELGDRVRVGPYSVVADSVIGADTEIRSHCNIDGVTMAAACVIGPFARLRPGTKLTENVRIGNFVEIKNSQIDGASKVNHLTYIGDATIGRNVNVGAGTITCNYDGANKHRTIIGANAFIGSGVMLVAPVNVGEGATIGAGSTISKDTPDQELTVARARQVTVEGWTRPVKKPK